MCIVHIRSYLPADIILPVGNRKSANGNALGVRHVCAGPRAVCFRKYLHYGVQLQSLPRSFLQ